ncbi:MAG: efflux RND transporter permease subunit [Treponemataceae bacterium]|nr:MAG: efflux RND transporter permease subunit [Treponemataceae bacterium]
MNISELSVRKPVTVTMLYVLVCVIAAVFVPRLGIALFPDITNPVLNVSTTYSNVGPEEIDKTVTQPILNQLSRVADVKKITSTSSSGFSRIQIEFGYDKDLDEAQDDITAVLTRIVAQLPDDAGTPTIRKFDLNAMPVMQLSLTGDASLSELKTIAEDTVQPLLERISGVASVDVRGGATREIHVDVSNNRLEAYNLTLTTITSALASRNIQISNGTLTSGTTDYEIVTDEYFKSVDDIRDTIITSFQSDSGSSIPVRLSDLAEIYETNERSGNKVYIDGSPGLDIAITNESGTNPSGISKSVNALIKSLEENKTLPNGISIITLYDNTSLIDSTMNQVYAAGTQGAILAMLIIFLFLRNKRSSFIIGLSIPISVLITLMVMSMLDLTINMMTMSGLILGMGMTVDSSIVILENINRRRAWGEKTAIAAILGSRNMFTAIMASTATTVCVFVPLLVYKADIESYGVMFQELVITIVVSLIASLIVSVTLVPALCGSIVKIDTRTQKPVKNPLLRKIDGMFENFFANLENGYAGMLRWVLKNRFLTIVLVAALCVVALQRFGASGMNLGSSANADDQVRVSVTLPTGTNNDEVQRYIFAFQDIVTQEIPRDVYKTIVINTGGSNSGTLQINLPPLQKQKMSATEIKAKLTPFLTQWSGVTMSFSAGRGGFGGGGGGIDVKIVSDNEEGVAIVADEILALLRTFPELTNPAIGTANGSPRYEIRINTDAASAAGVSVNTIASVLRTAITGSTATTYHVGGNDVGVIVSLTEKELQGPVDLGAISINTSSGIMSLDNFISYTPGFSPRSIQRENNVRVNHVTASLAQGAVATTTQAKVDAAIAANIVLPEGVKIEQSGDATQINRLMKPFILIIALALFLVFAVMAAQFESLVDPLIIFASIPLLGIGVVFIHLLMGEAMSILSMVGIVALVGIVVNNGIVLVDFTNQLVDRKTPVMEACVEAGRNRLQPILMTTLTTVIGMAPLAFTQQEGAQQMQPICLTIVGGLLTGAFMTLFVSPTLYSLLNKRREKRFSDPEALINQLEELDKMLLESSGKVDLIRKKG